MYTRNKVQKEANSNDINWDTPGFNGNNLKSGIILKTYSKKTPYVLVSATRQGVEEGILSSKSEQKPGKLTSRMKRKRQAKSFAAHVDSCKKKNKTTVSLASMSPCTVLSFLDDDASGTGQPMSLCSVSNGITNVSCGVRKLNSTLLVNKDDVDINFVPDDISLIEGDQVHQTMNDEWTFDNQALQCGPSLKKVKFSVGRISQKSKVAQCRKQSASARSSILKKHLPSIENPPECYRDITPETSNPAKIYSGSGKQRRRLSYQPDETVSTCNLLDFPVSKGKTASILSKKSSDLIRFMQIMDSFPNQNI